MPFNLSETMVLLVYVFSRLIAENDRSQVRVVTGEVSRILKETLMLLKPLNGMRFKDLIYYLEDSLHFLANMFPTSPVLLPMLWDMENHL